MVNNKRCQALLALFFGCCLCTLAAALEVENQLVSARNDCFERIALEAMLPFEKTFLTVDINSLRICKEKCIQEGDKCQTISFGVHRRGNGTCQLSNETFGGSEGGGDKHPEQRDQQLRRRRPSGVLFDPDFDLYERKTNCFDFTPNTISAESDLDRGSKLPASTTFVLPHNKPLTGGTPMLLVNPTITTNISTTNSPAIVGINFVSPSSEDATFSHIPFEPPQDGPTASSYVPSEPVTQPLNSSADHLFANFPQQDMYPLYKYPTLYENKYPISSVNGEVYIPGGYATNAPAIESIHHTIVHVEEDSDPHVHQYPPPSRNPYNQNGPPRPMFGLGYGNGYGYGQPVLYGQPVSLQPYDYNGGDFAISVQPPTIPDPHWPGYLSQIPSSPSSSASSHVPVSGNSRNQSSQAGQSARPGSSRPPPPPTSTVVSHPVNYAPNVPARPDNYSMRHRNTSLAAPQPGYGGDRRINTYFNPDDYLQAQSTKRKKRPGGLGFADWERGWDRSSDQVKACFRRVLAGKRVTSQWVRRTLACEQIEDCMRECGREKHFPCEGFNYKLDPSGYGQGVCELIDVPLAHMDLYSSRHSSDTNLLRHPDYDYYERDRNAPANCRNSACTECKPLPYSSSPSSLALATVPVGTQKGAGNLGDWFGGSRRGEIGSSAAGSGSIYYNKPPESGSVEHYHTHRLPHRPPPPVAAVHPPPQAFDSHHSFEQYGGHSGSFEFSSHDSQFYEQDSSSLPKSGGTISSESTLEHIGGPYYPAHHHQPHSDHWHIAPSSTGSSSDGDLIKIKMDRFRPPYHPGPNYSPYRSTHILSGPAGIYRQRSQGKPSISVSNGYDDRHQHNDLLVPYLAGGEDNWGAYGGTYGGISTAHKHSNYWGVMDEQQSRHRDPINFNYFKLGGRHRFRSDPQPYSLGPTLIGSSYPGLHYNKNSNFSNPGSRDNHDIRRQWTRRPGTDECSAKTSEGFRLNRKIVNHIYSAPTLTECERLCSNQDTFVCQTFSYRYAPNSRDNCLLCEKPINHLDYYVDIEPDRDYDIYSMTDDMQECRRSVLLGVPPTGGGGLDSQNDQCFFRAIDSTRFYKSIVRDSLTVRSVGECEIECIKSTKFTCRAFAFRYRSSKRHHEVIDNCQLSDWPVRDMDKERHLIPDASFDIFERASYGQGCELQAIMDAKQKKLCYLGYSSPAKLISPAIKKVITVSSELECKKECIRFRESTPFKCFSFSYGSGKSSFNCEMSPLDQMQLKLNVHYVNTDSRDFWLFAWNPFDHTCRDKVTTISGHRTNNNRRMDIFQKSGELSWRHYSVSGRPCRRNSPCEKNLITGFYSCEMEGGEIGSWDYCCKASHPCGYSRGFRYPWCLVGDETDQWRKCSDRYFPVNNGTRSSHAEFSLHDDNSKSYTAKLKPSPGHPGTDSSNEYGKAPRGGIHSLNDFAAARLWPVTYLYSDGPPNSTELSNFVDCNKEHC